MATFTPQEVLFLQEHGNAKAKTLYRAQWTPESYAQPSSGDLEGLRRFIRFTFVERRWVETSGSSKRSEPAEARTAAKKETKRPPQGIPNPEPLSSILGPDIPKLSVSGTTAQKPAPVSPAPSSSLIDLLGDFSLSTPSAPAAAPAAKAVPSVPTYSAPNSSSNSMDLLAGISFSNQAQSPAMPLAPASAPSSFDPFASFSSAPISSSMPTSLPAYPVHNAPFPQTAPVPTPLLNTPWGIQTANVLQQMGIPVAHHPQILVALQALPPNMHAAYLQQLQRQYAQQFQMMHHQQQQQHFQLQQQQQQHQAQLSRPSNGMSDPFPF